MRKNFLNSIFSICLYWSWSIFNAVNMREDDYINAVITVTLYQKY